MGKRSRDKGKRGELEAAEALRAIGIDAARGCQFAGGEDSPDIRTAVPDVHFEVKRTEALRLYDAIAQATKDAAGKVPVVLHRRSRSEWLVVVPLKELQRFAVQVYLTLARS